MQEFWAGYVKPTPAEAKRHLEERKLNAERLPWVLRFDIKRPCEARDWTPRRQCKNKALWAYVNRFVADKPGYLHVVCWTHLAYGLSSMHMVDVTNEWYGKNGWQDLGGIIHPYSAEIDS
jgi:hypothetical protein